MKKTVKDTEIFHLLVHSSNAYNHQVRSTEAWNPTLNGKIK